MVPRSQRGWARSRAQTSARQAVVPAGPGVAGGDSEELDRGGRSPGEARAALWCVCRRAGVLVCACAMRRGRWTRPVDQMVAGGASVASAGGGAFGRRRRGGYGVQTSVRFVEEVEGVAAEVMGSTGRRGEHGGCGVTAARLQLRSGARGRESRGGGRGRERVRGFQGVRVGVQGVQKLGDKQEVAGRVLARGGRARAVLLVGDAAISLSVQVKPSKRAKKNKPAEEPVLTEPEASAHEPPSAPAPATTVPSDEQVMEGSDIPEIPSPAHPDDPDVVITRTEFVEPGRPTVLARCSAKEELLERRRARLDITDYANLRIGDIVSGYVNQVHNSRDLEIDMVKQIQQKSEAACKKFESEISDLKNRLKTQESETQKANSKFEFSVSAQEKLKKKFEAERKAWADEKTALLSRAKQAEAALTERTAELSGLKRHVSQMVSAIFVSPLPLAHLTL
ncbi:uncharacterized protein [Aegilops tauschii subsp. strangulata]|uniref:uncharacterized protein n=1 Tax=Aegilops tauschii subsp. strangulata TaxID=200361 RepID=UPI003CC8DC88